MRSRLLWCLLLTTIGTQAHAEPTRCRLPADVAIAGDFLERGAAYPFLDVPTDLPDRVECLPGGPARIKVNRAMWVVPGANAESTSFLEEIWRTNEFDFTQQAYVATPSTVFGTKIAYLCRDRGRSGLPGAFTSIATSFDARPSASSTDDACAAKLPELIGGFAATSGCAVSTIFASEAFGQGLAYRALQCMLRAEPNAGHVWLALFRCDPATSDYVKDYQRLDVVDLQCPP
jgi:hypothetical protein